MCILYLGTSKYAGFLKSKGPECENKSGGGKVKTEGGASVAKIPVIAVADCTVATRLTGQIVKQGFTGR
jgi:hypothetical protein